MRCAGVEMAVRNSGSGRWAVAESKEREAGSLGVGAEHFSFICLESAASPHRPRPAGVACSLIGRATGAARGEGGVVEIPVL